MPATAVSTQPGQTVTIAQRFLREGSPLAVSEPISYVVRSGSGLLLAYGVASQTPASPEEWTAAVTIPATAEPGDYEVTWTAKTAAREVERTSTISVTTAAEVVDEAVSVYAGTAITDTLELDSAAENVVADVIDPAGTVIGTYTIQAVNAGADGKFRYLLDGPMTARNVGHNGVLPYGIHWRYTQGGERHLVTRSAYVFDHRMISQIETMRRFLDKSRTLDVNPSLRFTDVELAHFLLMGLQRLNSVPPSGAYTVAGLPQSLYYAWQRCAEHEALNALYLAVGTSTFNFSGQGSQIEYDIGPAIQTKMDELGQWIDTQLPIMKRELKRKSSLGVLGISLGPGINYPNTNGLAEAVALLSRGSRFFPLI